MNPKSKPLVLVTSIAALLGCGIFMGRVMGESTGIFSNSGALGTGDNDAAVGLNVNKTYLEAINLNGDTAVANVVVNGVTFASVLGANPTGTGGAGTGYSFAGEASLYNGGGANPAGQLGALTNRFIYGGNPGTMTLTGLTAGQTYVVTFYDRSWEGAGNRFQTITATGASTATTLFDLDVGATAQGNLNLLRYTFQAASATQTLSLAPQNPLNTMHLYAFTNEQTFNNAWVGGANWTTAAWSVSQPNGAGSNASFAAQGTPTTINLDAARTVGHVQFDGTNAWTIAGGNTLTLQADVGGVSVLSALVGSHTIATPVALATDAVKLGAGTITLTGPVSGTKGLSVNDGTLNLAVANSYSGGTTVNAGALLNLGAGGSLGATGAALAVNTGGLVNVGGFSQNVGALTGGGTIANNATGTNTILTAGNGDATSTFAGTIADHTSGTGLMGLTKIGTGTLTLSGTSSYTGPTTISGGRLQLNASAAAGALTTSGIDVGPGTTLGFSTGLGTTLTLKSGSTLTLSGGTLVFDIGTSAASDKIAADTFSITASSALSYNPIAGLNFGSPYTLATYNTLLNPGNFTFPTTTAGRLTLTPTLAPDKLTVTPTLDASTWISSTGGTWSTAGSWSSYIPTAAGDAAIFGPALAANDTVTLSTARSVGYLIFNNTAASYTIGTAGSSLLTFDNGASTALLSATAGTHRIAENIALLSDLVAAPDAGTAITISGLIGGAKSLTKLNPGTLILTNANAFTGGTTVSAGILQLGDGTTNGSVAGGITDNATVAFNNGSAQTAATVIGGTGKVTKTGAGTLTITGANTFTGGLTIAQGTVDISGNSALGSLAGTITNNATLRISRTGGYAIPNVVNGSGNTIVSGGVSAATATTLAPGASINTPTLTIGDDGVTQGWLTFGAANQLNGTTGVLLNITAIVANSRINLNGFDQTIAGLTGTGIVQNNESGTPGAATLTINVPGANSYSWTGLIRNQAGGALGLTKTGTGEQTMNFSITNPTYSGATTVSQGRLVFGSTLALPTWSTSGIAVAAGAEVGLTGGSGAWAEGVVVSGAGGLARTGTDGNVVTINNATNTFTGAARLGGTGVLAVSTLANIGTNSPLGAGTATNAATNAASLIFDGGTLRYTGAAVNANRLFTVTQNGGTLDASGSSAVNFTNSGALAATGTGSRTLTLTGTNTGNNTLAGALPDSAGGVTSLAKNGAGTWLLSGANSYTGATTINAGRLQLDGSAATSTVTSNLIVNPTATLGFSGGTGSTLVLTNTLTLAGGTAVFDLGAVASSDKITTGTLAITANSAFTFNQIGGYEFGQTYTLVSSTNSVSNGGFTISGASAGRLTLQPVIGTNAVTLTPQLDSSSWNSATGGVWGTGPWSSYTPDAIGDAARFGPALTSSGTITLNSPRTIGFALFDNTSAAYTIGIPGSSNLTFANTGTVAAQVVVSSGSHTIAENVVLASDLTIFSAASTGLTISGTLDGSARSVTKTGPGALLINGANNFGIAAGSAFNINQGSVIVGSATALAPTGNVTLGVGASLDLNANSATVGSLAGTGGTISDSSGNAGQTTFTINQTVTSAFGGIFADGAARPLAVVKSGAGAISLTGANTFTGDLTISNGTITAASGFGPAIPGHVTFGTGGGVDIWLISGAATQQYGANTVITFANGPSNAKFELRGTNQTLAGVDSALSNNISIIQNDELTAPGYTVAPGTATLTLNTATDHSYYGIIREQVGGLLSIVKNGAGTQEFINNPTIGSFNYGGSTTINAGKLVLNLSGATSAGYNSPVTVNAAGTLGLDGNWTLARTVSGAGIVIKQGGGTVTVSAALTNTGSTTISSGTLAVGVGGSISGSTTIDVKSGAVLNLTAVPGFATGATQMLKGGGTVVGAATIGGTLAPGNSIGTLSTDALTLATGSTFALEINTSSVAGLVGASDLLAVNGAFSIGTGVAPTLSISDLGSNALLAAGTTFTFVSYNGGWNGGLFKFNGNTIADDAILTYGANSFRLDYNAGSNSVALIAVPEPASATLLLASAALLGLRRRRR